MRAERRYIGRIAFLCLIALTLALQSSSGQSVLPTGQATTRYALAVRLPVSQDANGVDGYLEVRQDARLNPKLKSLLWGTGDANIDDNPTLSIFKTDPPKNAEFRLVDRAGRILESKTLERPLAKLQATQLYGDSSLTYLLTIDYSAGFGSYSGPITSLWDVKDGHMHRVESTEVKTGRSGVISLMESLKTTWKFVDAPNGKGKQILFAQCRPDWSSVKEDPDFTITYARLYFDDSRWLVIERKVKGYTDF